MSSQKLSKNKSVKGAVRRLIYSYARLLHVYISTALFALLIFFCVTGFFLNHLDTFGGRSTDNSVEVEFDRALKTLFHSVDDANPETVLTAAPLIQLQDYLSNYYGLPSPTHIEIDAEVGELILDYSLPAGYASAIFIVHDELLVIEYQKGNWMAIVNDLHKGRHTGGAWSWVIDVSAWLMVVFAITGFVLIFQNKRQRIKTFAVTLLGGLTPVGVYWLYVPSVSGL